MRTLLYVPIIHMDIDLGSLAHDIAKRGIRELGEEVYSKHRETVSGFWDSIIGYFDNIEVSGFKIYQDGMVADGEVGEKMVEEGLKAGSKNYELVFSLLKRGAILVKTEDFALVKKERDYLVELTKAKTGILFIGVYHNIIPMLEKDIRVKEIKEIKKLREYHKILLRGKKYRKRLEVLAEYLISPIQSSQGGTSCED